MLASPSWCKLGCEPKSGSTALAKIVKFGMKVVLKQGEQINALRESQKQTDERLNALIQVVGDVRRRPN